MAKLIKCAKCPFHIDITSVAPGTVIECPNCGAGVRVPTGQTGAFAAASKAESEAERRPGRVQGGPRSGSAGSGPQGRTGGGRTTKLFRKMAGANPTKSGARELAGDRGGARNVKNNSTVIVGAIAGVVALAVIAFLVLNQGSSPAPAPEKKAESKPAPTASTPPVTPATPASSSTPKAAETPPEMKMLTRNGVQVEVPVRFQTGARDMSPVDPGSAPAIDKNEAGEIDQLLKSGGTAPVVARIEKAWPIVLDRVLSDDETLARGALQVIDKFCQDRDLKDSKNQLYVFDWELFNKPLARVEHYAMFFQWFSQRFRR